MPISNNQFSNNTSTLKTYRANDLAEIIRNGGVVVFPTETVYGMGASSLNESACHKIYRIKNRPNDNPLIVHCLDLAQVENFAKLSNQGRALWERFAPGPLTLVLPKKSPQIFSTGLETLAIRIPAHNGLREILTHLGSPISAPSANLSGRPSITREMDAIQEFDGLVDGILLEGMDSIISNRNLSEVMGLESTVLDLTGVIPILLRPGSIEKEAMEEVLGSPIEIPDNPQHLSPGVKYKHYSPLALVKKFNSMNDIPIFLELNSIHPSKIGVLHYKSTSLPDVLAESAYLCSVGSNLDYAKNLYSFFIDADRYSKEVVFCESPKSGYLNFAINNRLAKAASG